MLGEREDPAELHRGQLPVGWEEGSRAHSSSVAETWGTEEVWARRAEGCAVVSLCSGVLQQPGREGTAEIPPFCLGKKKVAPSPPLFLFASSVPPPPCLRSCHASVILSFSVRFRSPFKGPSRVSAVLAQKASLISCLFSFASEGGGGKRERASGFKIFLFGLLHSQRGQLPGTPF